VERVLFDTLFETHTKLDTCWNIKPRLRLLVQLMGSLHLVRLHHRVRLPRIPSTIWTPSKKDTNQTASELTEDLKLADQQNSSSIPARYREILQWNFDMESISRRHHRGGTTTKMDDNRAYSEQFVNGNIGAVTCKALVEQ